MKALPKARRRKVYELHEAHDKLSTIKVIKKIKKRTSINNRKCKVI